MTLVENGNAEAILKQDVLGRVVVPKKRREELLDEFERGGMSGMEFANWVGIKYPTFASWIQARRRKRRQAESGEGETGEGKVNFVEATFSKSATSASAGLVIELADGTRIKVSDAKGALLAVEMMRYLSRTAKC